MGDAQPERAPVTGQPIDDASDPEKDVPDPESNDDGHQDHDVFELIYELASCVLTTGVRAARAKMLTERRELQGERICG